MTILGASILFNRGSNTHNQLRLITSKNKDPKYKEWFKILDNIFASDNTRSNREELQYFLIENGEEIYRIYSRYQEDHGQNDFGYSLKSTEK